MATIEPVEIEFVLRENITQQTKTINDSLAKTATTADSASQEITQKIGQQQAVINQANAMLDLIESRAAKVGKTSNKEQINSVLQASQAQRAVLEQQQQALNGVSADTSRLNEVTAELSSRLRDVTRLMVGLANAGERNSSAYQKLAEEQNLLNDALGNSVKSATVATEALSMPATALKERIMQEKAAIEQIKLDIQNLNNQLATASPAKKVSIQADLGSAKSALFEEKNILLALEQQVESTGGSFASLRQQLMSIRNEMGQMILAGEEDTAMYREKEAELQRLGVVYRKVQTLQKELTKGGTGAQALGEGVMAVSGAFTAAQGVMSLFASKNEDLERIEKNLQAAMSITIGLSMTMQVLHQTSAFRIEVVTKLTRAWAAAEEFLNVQLGISAVVSKALMLTGIGLLIAGFGLLVGVIEKTIKAEQERQKLAEIGRTLDKAAAAEIATHRAALDALLSTLHNEASSLKTKKEALEKIKEIIPSYNAAISDTGRITNENTTAINNYIEALGRQALAEAAKKSMADIYQRKLNNEIDQAKSRQDVTDAEATRTAINSQAGSSVGGGVAGGTAMNTVQNLASEQVVLKKAALQKTINEADSIQKELDITKSVLDKNSDALLFGETKKTKTPQAASANEKVFDTSDLIKKEVEFQHKIDAARIAAMQDGVLKRKAEAKKEYDEELDYVKIQREEIQKQIDKAGLTKDKVKIEQANTQASVDNSKLDILAEQAAKTYEGKIKTIDKASKEAIEAIFEDVNSKFKSELDRNLEAVDKYYKEQIKKAEEAGASIAQIRKLVGDWNVERNMTKSESKSKQLEFEEQIELEKQKIANQSVIFEADREEKILNIRRDYLVKQRMLLEQQPKSQQNSNKIVDIDTAITDIDDQKSGLGVKKMQEIVGYAGQLSEAFRGVNDELSQMFGYVVQVAGAITKMASGHIAEGVISILATGIEAFINAGQQSFERLMNGVRKVFDQLNVSLDNSIKKLADKSVVDPVRAMQDTFSKLISAISMSSWQLEAWYLSARKVGTTAQQVVTGLSTLNDNYANRKGKVPQSFATIKKEAADIQNAIDLIIKRLGEGGVSTAENGMLTATLQQLQTQQGNLSDLMAKYQEMLLGTTSDSIVSSIANAFQNSKSTITDFANTFQDLMKNAVISSLKTKMLEGPLEEWYNTFTKMSEKGLTTDDVTKLRDMYNTIIGNAQTEFTTLQNATGVNFAAASDTNALSGSVSGMSEDTGSALVGNITALRLNIATILENDLNAMSILQKSLNTQIEIATNTKTTSDVLKTIYWMMGNWDLNGVKVK